MVLKAALCTAVGDGGRSIDKNRGLAHSATIATIAAVTDANPAPIDLPILHEDERLLAVAKPAGLLSQPTPDEGDSVLTRLAPYLGHEPGLVHRLDRPVSGVMVVAKDRDSAGELSSIIRDRKAAKCYLALVRTGVLPIAGMIREAILKVRHGKMVTDSTGRPAISRIAPIAFDPEAEMALVAIRLITGRMHQARVHLSAEVGAIVGDRKYGDVAPAGDGAASDRAVGTGHRIALHAVLLKIPGKKRKTKLVLRCPPGDDFWALAGGANLPRDTWDEAVESLLR